MTLDQLRVFVAVAERQHLTQAAGALRLTPSAVSAAIQALETRYATRLFDRVGRRIELSAAGRTFLAEAKATLASAASAERALTELGGLARGTLAVAGSQTIATYWLPAVLMRFQANHPTIALTAAEGNTEQVARIVLDGGAELGFVEGDVDHPALAKRPVGDDRLAVVAAPAHPLAACARIEPGQLAAAAWILREKGSGTRAVFAQSMREGGIDPETLDVVLELPSNEAICAAVRASRCLAAVSTLVAVPHVEAGRLQALRVSMAARRFYLIRHKERFRSKAAEAFEALIDAQAKSDARRRDPISFDI